MMKSAAALAGLVLILSSSACGSDAPSEQDLMDELTSQGFSDSIATCVVDEIKGSSGSLDEFGSLEASEQQDLAARAGAECAQSADPEEIDDVLEGVDADLSDPAVRDGIVTGLTSQGASEELANCIVDEAVAQDLEATDFTDEAVMTPIFETCSTQ